jgi:hypothetical protein
VPVRDKGWVGIVENISISRIRSNVISLNDSLNVMWMTVLN